MTLSSWYLLAKDFAGPLATTLAAATAAYITYSFQIRQILLSENKLMLDLFEKRYEIFASLNQLLGYVISTHFQPGNIDHVKIRDLRRHLDEARFLCSRSTIDFIKKCDDACEDLIIYITTQEPAADEPRSHFALQASLKTGHLRELYEDVSRQFERELRVETPPR